MQTPVERVRVVVVDDHPFMRDGISRGLASSGRIEVVGEAGDGRAGLASIVAERPDVALVDYHMPVLDGLGLLQAVVRDELPTKVLLLSAFTDSPVVFSALAAGAAGYLSKDSRRQDIVEAVLRVSRGETVVPPELTSGLVAEIRTRTTLQEDKPMLSERERQVLDGFARGLSVPELARELFLGASTVKTHAQSLYQKLGVGDRAAAVAVGMRLGLLD